MSDEEEEVEYDALVEEASLPTSSLAVTVDFADLLRQGFPREHIYQMISDLKDLLA